MHKKNLFKWFLLGVLTVLVLSACGSGDNNDVTVKEDESQEATKQEETKKEEAEGKKEEESKVGSRSNPVAFNNTATIEDEIYNEDGKSFAIKFDLTVTEISRGEVAFQQLEKMNEFNEPAPEGYEWILAKAKVKFIESETKDFPFNIDGIMNFEMISESGDIYSGEIVGTTEPDFSFEMYVGNEKEGYISGLVKTGEKAQLRYNALLGTEAFFNLE